MRRVSEPPLVAIACQGGGSHTAFTAGVLKRLLRPEELDNYCVAGLSGTSGGGVCGLLAWCGLVSGNPADIGTTLEQYWADVAARSPLDRLSNDWLVRTSELQDLGVMPVVSPYHTWSSVVGADLFRRWLERRVDFASIEVDEHGRLPMLLLGAADVLSGEFKVFNSRRDRICVDMALASAAVPNLFRAVRLGSGTYWDGLFSQNPPVRELTDVAPNELWVIQINPTAQDTEPTSVGAIADRRNELSGNLSLVQELYFIQKVNELLDRNLLPKDGKYKPIRVRVIELARSAVPQTEGAASKLSRAPSFIRDLISAGERQAEDFLVARAFERAWSGMDDEGMVGLLRHDVELQVATPFPQPGQYPGVEDARGYLTRHFGRDVLVDHLQNQVVGERVTWGVQLAGASATRPGGRAEAELRWGRVGRLRLWDPTAPSKAKELP
jgi:NTE family protein